MYLDCSPVVLAVPVKVCKKCGEVKPHSRDYFRVHRDGRMENVCLVCTNATRKTWRENNSDKAHEYNRAWRKANPDRARELALNWERNNRDKRKVSNRQWYLKNGDRQRRSSQLYRKEHPGITYENTKKWRRNNPQMRHAHNARRRSRKCSLPSTFTSADWQSALNYFNGCCAVCGRQSGLWHTLAADHWIPLTSPDCPGTVAWNIVPLCHGVDGCNNSKHANDPADWLTGKFGPRKGRAILRKIEAYLESRMQR